MDELLQQKVASTTGVNEVFDATRETRECKQKRHVLFLVLSLASLKPGFHIVVSVVSVVSVRTKKIHRTDITLWKPPVQMLNTKEATNTTCCTR